jgi:hypothetical protein
MCARVCVHLLGMLTHIVGIVESMHTCLWQSALCMHLGVGAQHNRYFVLQGRYQKSSPPFGQAKPLTPAIGNRGP